MVWFMLVAGLVLLIIGADVLVRGAARLAAAFGVPALVIGLTVVAFGTSAPELAVSVKSSFAGQAELAIANVVGSNIFNVLFILGLSALVAPLVVSQQLIRQDVPIMIGLSALVVLMTLDCCCIPYFCFIRGVRIMRLRRMPAAARSRLRRCGKTCCWWWVVWPCWCWGHAGWWTVRSVLLPHLVSVKP